MRRNSSRQQLRFPVWPWEPMYRSFSREGGRASHPRRFGPSHRHNNSRPTNIRRLDTRRNMTAEGGDSKPVGVNGSESSSRGSHDARMLLVGATVSRGRKSSVACGANTTSKNETVSIRNTSAFDTNQGLRRGGDTIGSQANFNQRNMTFERNHRPRSGDVRRPVQFTPLCDRYAVHPGVTYKHVEQVLPKEKLEALQQSHYQHSHWEGDASRQPASYLQSCRVSSDDGSVTCCLSPALLSQLESRQLLLCMVGVLNSGGGLVLVGADSGTGCVRGTSAGAGVLGAFMRGVLSIDRTLILPHMRRGQTPRCGVRCVPVENIVTRVVLRDTWVVEIHLDADKSEFYNPFCNSDYYHILGGGSVGVLHCTPFKRFCCSVLNTCAMTYAASPIQQMYEEVMDLEERLQILQLSKDTLSQSNDSRNLSRTEESNTGGKDATQRDRRQEKSTPVHGIKITGQSLLTATSQPLTGIQNVQERREVFSQTGSTQPMNYILLNPECGSPLNTQVAFSDVDGVVATKMTERGSPGDVRSENCHCTLAEGTSQTAIELSPLPGTGHPEPGIMCSLCWFKDCPINCYAV